MKQLVNYLLEIVNNNSLNEFVKAMFRLLTAP